MSKVVLCVRFRTKPGQKEVFRKHLYRAINAMKEEKAFVNTIVHDFIDEPNDLLLYEIWHGTRDSWMREEFTRPYRQPYESIVTELIEERTVNWLTPVGEWGSTLLNE
jgi:quinol monooxygenase YgiN